MPFIPFNKSFCPMDICGLYPNSNYEESESQILKVCFVSAKFYEHANSSSTPSKPTLVEGIFWAHLPYAFITLTSFIQSIQLA